MARSTRNVPRPVKPKAHNDDWSNVATGFGVLGKDKRLGSTFATGAVDQVTAEEVWRGDDVMARIVEKPVDEMLRQGFDVCIDSDKEAAEAVEHALRQMNAVELARDALHYSRALGGGGMLLGVDDGSKNLELPLAEDRIRSFEWMNVFTPRELQPVRYYADQTKAKYGQIATYRLAPLNSPPGATPGAMPVVHESRIIRVPGVKTTRRATFFSTSPGWDDSIMVRLMQVVNDYQAAWQGTSILLSDFAPAVLALKGLANLLAGQKANAETVSKRAAAIELCRSIARTVIIDADKESYKRETTSVAGLSDILDKLCLRLAQAANMPVSMMMGQAPAGMNATGASDIRFFYDQVQGLQTRYLLPMLNRIVTLIFLNKSGPTKGKVPKNWKIELRPLWQPTQAEIATSRLAVAQADKIYIEAAAVTGPEVAKSRWGGDAYSPEMQIDVELRDKLLEDEELQQAGLGAAPEPDHTFDPATGKPMPGVVVAAPPKPVTPG